MRLCAVTDSLRLDDYEVVERTQLKNMIVQLGSGIFFVFNSFKPPSSLQLHYTLDTLYASFVKIFA